MDKIETYEALARRNGWDFSLESESQRPYFMKNGKYAVPTSETSKEDKELLAEIISEGSDELKRIALMCWDKCIAITGPCSGIREYHDKPPMSLHVGFIGPREAMVELHQKVQELLPQLGGLLRETKDGQIRYDIDYFLDGKELTKEQSDAIFKIIADLLAQILGIRDEIEKERNF